ncbi:hypothetical protein DPMN_095371 [Dreissena polymorpha]|uniref:Uncharacterized protein n=1 Tax=Dreissena polymorpha TaxID=45954 RepID=A0A9D4L7F7_DREPO|nr:hypothetical protein DPMN_095371 [Dreissena polymorpha]
MACCDCDDLLFTCWSKTSTTVFKVTFDETLWTVIWKELTAAYNAEGSKRPKRFPENKRKIEEMINEFRRNCVTFIREFPSCHVSASHTEVNYDGRNEYV